MPKTSAGMDSVSNWTPRQVVDWMKGEVQEFYLLSTGKRLKRKIYEDGLVLYSQDNQFSDAVS